MATNKQLKYWHVLIYDICKWLDIPRKDYERAKPYIHKALKDYFNISSLKDLSSSEFEKLALGVRIIWSVNFGYVLREPDEEKIDPNNISFKLFILNKMIPINTLLYTKDGRKIGNAIVIDHQDLGDKIISVITTDYGNKGGLTDDEIYDMFWIGEKAHSSHKHFNSHY